MLGKLSLMLAISLVAYGSAQAQQSKTGVAGIFIVYTNPSLDGVSKHRSFNPRPGDAERAQEELRSNPALRGALLKRNVQLRNVIAIDTGSNGNRTIYLR